MWALVEIGRETVRGRGGANCRCCLGTRGSEKRRVVENVCQDLEAQLVCIAVDPVTSG